RQVAKLRSTYADGLLPMIAEDGRIHTVLKQTGAATGRLSSTDPNLQNIPVRTDIGRELRRYFIAKNEDYTLIDADYSQIELRLLAHIADDRRMLEAFARGEDIHTSTAAAVFGVPADEVTPELRKRAKAVNFGIVYGIGDYSLSLDLGITRAQAREFIAIYLEKFEGVAAYLQNIVQTAYEKGYVTTLFGRRRPIPELRSKNRNLRAFGERVAMNSPIQGSAADIIKLAMINVHRRFAAEGLDARLILQVHDELIVESEKACAKEAEKILKEEMEGAVSLNLPLSVDISSGPNWLCK
ncbi:MAG: DNA polymerase I, partial [Clostridiales bacterium]|nr:DNA polymerase I [Clostridiales bacterium]